MPKRSSSRAKEQNAKGNGNIQVAGRDNIITIIHTPESSKNKSSFLKNYSRQISVVVVIVLVLIAIGVLAILGKSQELQKQQSIQVTDSARATQNFFTTATQQFFLAETQSALETKTAREIATKQAMELVTQTATITVTPTSTTTPTPTITETFTPSPTSTTEPKVFRGLDEKCLSHDFWTPNFFKGESKEVDSRNCWDLTKWGIIPESKGLNFVIKDSDLGQDITRMLYTPIKGDTEIKFSVRINQFTTRSGFDGVFMMGVGSPSTILHSGYFLKYIVIGNDSKTYRDVGTGLKFYYEPRSTYSLGENQNIIIRIIGTQAKIIVDGTIVQTTTLSPDEHSVFWVAYSLPSTNGSLIADVSNFQIYDK